MNGKRTKHPSRPESGVLWIAWAARTVFFALAAVVATALIVFEPGSGLQGREFFVGDPAPRSFFSPVRFAYVDEPATERIRRERAGDIAPVFAASPEIARKVTEKIDLFFEVLNRAKHSAPELKASVLATCPFVIPEASLKLLLEEDLLEDVRKNIEIMLERNFSLGVISAQKKEELLLAGQTFLTVINSPQQTEKRVPTAGVMTLAEARGASERVLPAAIARKRNIRNAILDVYNAVMIPNLYADEAETRARKDAAYRSVPDVVLEVKKDELIVQRGILVTPEIKARLDRIQRHMAKSRFLNKWLATGALVFLAYMLALVYLGLFDRKKFFSVNTLGLIHCVLILNLILCKWAVLWPQGSVYLMPTPMAALILTLLVNGRIGFLGSFMMAVLSGPLADFDPPLISATLLSGLSATFIASRVRKRSHFLRVGFVVGAVQGLVILAVNRFQDYPWTDAIQTAAWGAGSCLFVTAPLCFFLIVPLLESFFGMVTDITLLELSDLNHPLLKKMVLAAPGTYHHSLVVSRLAEAAAEAIGANALLARVGCYFHDIGKIQKPDFFTENQSGGVSRHDKLSPMMSCLMIINHVRDGMALGRQYKLKDPILQFIPEHHGTGIVYYFYRKAMDSMRPGEGGVSADDFRYPGPKPQTRETAIALLADSSEAASRSLAEPEPEKLKQVVRKVINEKFIDGQLDECDLTLRDLHKIQKSFVTNLVSVYHTRVGYPTMPDAADKPDLFAGSQFSKFRVTS